MNCFFLYFFRVFYNHSFKTYGTLLQCVHTENQWRIYDFFFFFFSKRRKNDHEKYVVPSLEIHILGYSNWKLSKYSRCPRTITGLPKNCQK